jgi:hypothetical protein
MGCNLWGEVMFCTEVVWFRSVLLDTHVRIERTGNN